MENQSCYIWKCKFKAKNLLTEKPVKDKSIEFFSPHYPSTEKDKDYTDGELTITSNDLDYPVKEIATNGLEIIFALNNHVSHTFEITEIESPPGLFRLPGIKMKIEGYLTRRLKDPDGIPVLWNKYQKLIKSNPQELTRSIQWFMRAIKSENPIDKFIYNWITFNMLYGWLTGTYNHVKGIKGLTGKGIPRLKQQEEIVLRHRTILEGLSQMHLIDRHGINRAEKLRNALSGGDFSAILMGAIDAIGFIRHNIFHGNLTDRTAEAERCIWPLIHLNAEIIKHQLNKEF